MIDFEMPSPIAKQTIMLQTVAENMMRPVSRHMDDHEHEIPWDYINFMHGAMRATSAGSLAPRRKRGGRAWDADPGAHDQGNAFLGRPACICARQGRWARRQSKPPARPAEERFP
jgi:hypothetical protein